MRKIVFAKGHGTENDFVLVRDRHGMIDLSPADVRWLCDRRAGIGADGVLRLVSAQHVPEWSGDPGLWYMDYRNADGSIAEMCGNGLRVFARYLLEQDLVVATECRIATRAGERTARFAADGSISTGMGPVALASAPVEVTLAGRSWPATAVDVGNPHAVVHVADADELRALRLFEAPEWSPRDAFPEGANVEFVTQIADDRLMMRVHERGSGETRSCGTGVVASVAAHTGGADGSWYVDVPGGRLRVDLSDGQATLSGPAVIIGHGEVILPDA